MNLDKRQDLDILLWDLVISFSALFYYSLHENKILLFPIFLLLSVSLFLLYRNNKIALEEIKGGKRRYES